ncbi:hypothetical protein IW261DRAFT_1568598 [Armillaria novae-zelandiae]|uniref:Uncharacterized protein n=1 Tax=Armillaria novae-zelandiae TaxID=153914 RepID=A0AA39NZ70_9AGAR|nr:hypothetical protein IW261DRAFT_1568598 [Armillaria novae-zelandiae]
MKHFLCEVALVSSDPPSRPPTLIPGQFHHHGLGLGGCPAAAINFHLLRDLTQVYGGAAKITTLLGFHPRTICRYQLRWGLVRPGHAPFQLEYVDEDGHAHWHHCLTRLTMTPLTDAELDEVTSEVL